MNQLPTAEEFAKNNHPMKTYPVDWNVMIEFAKLHVEAALKKASEKAYYRDFSGYIRRSDENKNSILTAYPLTNIR